MLDHLNPVHDREISSHVLRMHQYRRPGEEEGAPTVDTDFMEEEDENEDEAPIFERYDKFVGKGRKRRGNDNEILSLSFLKKYLHFAKNRVKPTLTKAAADNIASAYAELRSNADTSDRVITTISLSPPFVMFSQFLFFFFFFFFFSFLLHRRCPLQHVPLKLSSVCLLPMPRLV